MGGDAQIACPISTDCGDPIRTDVTQVSTRPQDPSKLKSAEQVVVVVSLAGLRPDICLPTRVVDGDRSGDSRSRAVLARLKSRIAAEEHAVVPPAERNVLERQRRCSGAEVANRQPLDLMTSGIFGDSVVAAGAGCLAAMTARPAKVRA